MRKYHDDAHWTGLSALVGRRYKCGHCNSVAVSNQGNWLGLGGSTSARCDAIIYFCPGCKLPTLFDDIDNLQVPGVCGVEPVGSLPPDIGPLFDEIRRADGASAPTLVTLGCRKILMNVAVHKGAAENKQFAFYVDYLDKQNIIPAGSKDWIDMIRELGNEATHEIDLVAPDKAHKALLFTQMLLRLVYEFPGMMKTEDEGKA